MTNRTITDVERMNDAARQAYLKESWGMNQLRILGRLEYRKDIWWLRDITDVKAKPLEYPLADLQTKEALGSTGIYIGRDSDLRPDARHEGFLVSAQIELSRPEVREKRRNSLLIRVSPNSVEILKKIPPDLVCWGGDGSIDLEQSVYKAHLQEISEPANKQKEKLDEQIKQLKADIQDLRMEGINAEISLEEVKGKLKQAEEALDAVRQALSNTEEEHNFFLKLIEDDFAARRTQLELDLQAKVAEFEGLQETLRGNLLAIEQELVAAYKQRDRKHEEIRSQTNTLRAYAKTQAETLHRLELITDAHWDALFLNENDSGDPALADWPEFDGNTPGTLDYIQRYLFGIGVGYPRDLLSNFHALLGTGDLIFLSGLSGSGKTNLVKSYATATGNVAKVIPVKPNWTSAEDLIGFYNPLQKTYIKTPFLEALFEASRDPARLHILCLDEMNLARVEYYFADFLSRLEERKAPCIDLYPEDEAGHVLTELRVLIQALSGLNLDLSSVNLESLLADGPSMAQLAERLALADGESFPQLHSRIRRMRLC